MCAQVHTVSATQWSYEYQNYFKNVDMCLIKNGECMNKQLAPLYVAMHIQQVTLIGCDVYSLLIVLFLLGHGRFLHLRTLTPLCNG